MKFVAEGGGFDRPELEHVLSSFDGLSAVGAIRVVLDEMAVGAFV